MPRAHLMVQRILARCSSDNCKYWEALERLTEDMKHDLKCPTCGGRDFRLSSWTSTVEAASAVAPASAAGISAEAGA